MFKLRIRFIIISSYFRACKIFCIFFPETIRRYWSYIVLNFSSSKALSVLFSQLMKFGDHRPIYIAQKIVRSNHNYCHAPAIPCTKSSLKPLGLVHVCCRNNVSSTNFFAYLLGPGYMALNGWSAALKQIWLPCTAPAAMHSAKARRTPASSQWTMMSDDLWRTDMSGGWNLQLAKH